MATPICFILVFMPITYDRRRKPLVLSRGGNCARSFLTYLLPLITPFFAYFSSPTLSPALSIANSSSTSALALLFSNSAN